MSGLALDPSDLRAPVSATGIEAWAEERKVASWLGARLRVLEPFVAWDDRRWLYSGRRDVTLRDLFADEPPDAMAATPTVIRRLQKAARAFLEHRARDVHQALVDEQRRLARPAPAHPAVLALYEHLLAARALVRAGVLPLFERPRRAGKFDGDPPVFLLVEEDWPHQMRVTVPLQARRAADPLIASCSCTPGGPARCGHALGAFDDLLDVLVDPRHARETEALVAELSRPAWVRALAELDGRLAPEPRDADAEAARISWRLRRHRDAFAIEPVVQRPRKNGKLGSGARVRLSELVRHPPHGALDADREVIALLRHAELSPSEQRFLPRILLALVGHPRVTLGDPPYRSLAIRTGTLGLAILERGEGDVELAPVIDGEPIDAAAVFAGHNALDQLTWVYAEEADAITVVKAPSRLMTVIEVLARRGGWFPRDAVAALEERLPALSERVGVSLPASLRGEEVAADERMLLRLEALDGCALIVRALVRPLAEGVAFVPGQGPAEVVGWSRERRLHARRRIDGEVAAARAALAGLPLGAESEPFVWRLDRDEEALDFLAALQEAAGAFQVEWVAASRRVTRTAMGSDLRVRVEDRRDWFGLSGEVVVDGHAVPLGALLDAVRAQRRYVAVEGDVWVRIGDELRARLAPASDHVAHGRSGLEVTAMAAPAVAGLVDDEGAAPRRFVELLERLRRAEGRVPEAPPEVAGVLRDYQLAGFQWMSRLTDWSYGACLADDMGVGKTLQALALLSERARLGPALVVAPTSVGWNWVREAARFTPGLRAVIYRDLGRDVDRAAALASLGPGDVLVLSYGLLARDGDELAGVHFATLILDEAQAIKNPSTQRARAASALDAEFRLALTGTPVENRLAELWSLFRVVVPGLLGSWERFRDRFAAPIERSGDAERRGALARLVRPFLLRRLKSEVARELPARTEVRQDITLSSPERELYDRMRQSVLAELARPADANAPKRRFQVLAALLRLRQLACHPRLVDDRSAVPSSKLERCLELVEELREGGHRALIFSQFTSHLALVREALDAAEVPYQYLDGQTPPARREELCDAFQRGEGDVFLISLKAGGTGLNLTAADYVIHLDPWWNPAVEDQATDRAHRIGQERPVTVYRLVTRDTVEESILALHDDKRRLVSGILDGTDTGAAITTEELLALLKS